MNALVILSSNDPEIKWNAVRLANTLLEQGEDVTLFLNGPAVDLPRGESETFRIAEQAKLFTLSEGLLAAWGKCMDLHGVEASENLRREGMKFLTDAIRAADKILNY